jgi:NAD(P)H-hydrate repair Nnr-like enzyme with NAD(P)H-hydrate dehydratase domain
MAALTGRPAEWIEAHPQAVAQEVADRLTAVVVMKGGSTVIAGPGADPLAYAGGGPGLATGGSGDVLAGLLGGLLARGTEPRVAAAWAVWVHGEAGRSITHRLGGPGLLARELPPLIPELLHAPL